MSGAKDASEQEELLERNAASETESSSSSSEIFLISVIIATIVIALVPVYLLVTTLLNKMRKRATRAVGPETEEESVGPSASMPLNYSEAGTSQTVMVRADEVIQVAEPPVVVAETVDEAPDNDLPPFSNGCDDNVININLDSRTQHRHIRFLFQFNDPCVPCGGTGGQAPSNDDNKPPPPSFQGFFKYPPDGSDETSARVFFKGSVSRDPKGTNEPKPLAPPPNRPSTSGQNTKALPAPFQLQTSVSSPAFQPTPQLNGRTPGPVRERDVEGGGPAQKEISQVVETLVSKVDELEKTSAVGPQPTFSGNEPARVVHENETEPLKRKSAKKLKNSEAPTLSSEGVRGPLPAESTSRHEPPGTQRVERRSPEKEEGAVKPKKSKLRTAKVFPANENGEAAPRTTRSVLPPPAVSSPRPVSATPSTMLTSVTMPKGPPRMASVQNQPVAASPRIQATPLQTTEGPSAKPTATITALPKPASQRRVPAPAKLQQTAAEPDKPQQILAIPIKPQNTAPPLVKTQSVAATPFQPQATGVPLAKPEEKAPVPIKAQSTAAAPSKDQQIISAPIKPTKIGPEPANPDETVLVPVKSRDIAPDPVTRQDTVRPHPEKKRAKAKDTASHTRDVHTPEVSAAEAPHVKIAPSTNILSEEPKAAAVAPSVHENIPRTTPKRKNPISPPQAIGSVTSTHTEVGPVESSPRVPQVSPEVVNGPRSPEAQGEPITPALGISPIITNAASPAPRLHPPTPTVKATPGTSGRSATPAKVTVIPPQKPRIMGEQVPVPVSTENPTQNTPVGLLPSATPAPQPTTEAVPMKETPAALRTDKVPETNLPRQRRVIPNIAESAPVPAQPSSVGTFYPVEQPQAHGPSPEETPEMLVNRAGSPEMSPSDHHVTHSPLLPSTAVASIPVADPATTPNSHVSFTAPPTKQINDGPPPSQWSYNKQGTPPPSGTPVSKARTATPVPENRLPPKQLPPSPKISQRTTNTAAPANVVSMTQQTGPVPTHQNMQPPRHKHPPKPLWIPSIPPEASRTHKPGPSARPSVAPEPSTSVATAGPSCPRPPSLLNERWITEHRCARRLRHKSLPPSWRWCKKVPPAQPPACPRLPSVRFAAPTVQTQRNVAVKPPVVSHITSSRDFAPAAYVPRSFYRPSSSDSRVIPTTSSVNMYGPYQNFTKLLRGMTAWPTCQPQYQSMSCSRICGRPSTTFSPPSPDDSPVATSSGCFPSIPASPPFSACYVSRSSLIYQPFVLRQHQILHFYQRPTDLRQLVALPGRRLPFCTSARSTGRLMSLCKSPLPGKGTPPVCKSEVNSAINQDFCATGVPQDQAPDSSAEEDAAIQHITFESQDEDNEMTDAEVDKPKFVEVQASVPSRQLEPTIDVKASSETRTAIINVQPQRGLSVTSRVPYQTPLPMPVTETEAGPARVRSRPLARSTPPKSHSRQQASFDRGPDLMKKSLATVRARHGWENEPADTSQQPSDDSIAFYHVGKSSPLRQEYPIISKTTATSTTVEHMHELTVGVRQSLTTAEVPDEPPLKRRSIDLRRSESYQRQETIHVGIVAGPSNPPSLTDVSILTNKGETPEVHSEEGSDSDQSDDQALPPTAEGSEVSLPAPAAADSMLMLLRDETVEGREPTALPREDKITKPSSLSSFQPFTNALQNADPQRNVSEYAGFRRQKESDTSTIDSEPSWVPVGGEILRTTPFISTPTPITLKREDLYSHSVQDPSCVPKKPGKLDYLDFIQAPNIKMPKLICNEELVDKTSGILASFSIDKAVLQLMVGKETDCAHTSSSSAESSACCRTRSLLVIDNTKSCEGAPKAKEAEDVDTYTKKVKKK